MGTQVKHSKRPCKQKKMHKSRTKYIYSVSFQRGSLTLTLAFSKWGLLILIIGFTFTVMIKWRKWVLFNLDHRIHFTVMIKWTPWYPSWERTIHLYTYIYQSWPRTQANGHPNWASKRLYRQKISINQYVCIVLNIYIYQSWPRTKRAQNMVL